MERKSILTVFSNNCGYSSLILHQNAPSGNFLKPSYNMKAETTAKNPLYSCIKIHWSILHLHLPSKCWHILKTTVFLKCSLISPSIKSEIFLIIGRLTSSQWQKQALQNSKFCLKAQILSLTTLSVVFLKDRLHFSS